MVNWFYNIGCFFLMCVILWYVTFEFHFRNGIGYPILKDILTPHMVCLYLRWCLWYCWQTCLIKSIKKRNRPNLKPHGSMRLMLMVESDWLFMFLFSFMMFIKLIIIFHMWLLKGTFGNVSISFFIMIKR